MADISDLVPTLAAVAVDGVHADDASPASGSSGPRRATASATSPPSSRKLGADVDGRARRPAHRAGRRRCTARVLATHHDHRLAMAFGVLGTVVAGIEVADPDVVSKSWPDFWAARRAVIGGQ